MRGDTYQNYFISSVAPNDLNADLSREVQRFYSAYTVAELGEMLPMPIDKGGGLLYRLWVNRELVKDRIEVIYVNGRNSEDYFLTVADTEANARAMMLIYLIENKLLDPQTL